MHDAPDFLVTADDGVDFTGAGAGGEVGAVFFQRLVFPFWILIGDALGTADFFEGGEQGIVAQARVFDDRFDIGTSFGEGEQEVFDAQEFVFET